MNICPMGVGLYHMERHGEARSLLFPAQLHGHT